MTVYYYYTSQKQAAKIVEEGKIRTGSTNLGPGIFFVTAGPEDTKPAPLELLKQIYDEENLPTNEPLSKYTEYFAFPKDQVNVKRKKKGIFVMNEMIVLEGMKFEKGQVDH
eukprot:TRINITY_DN926_c0_g1_i1.p1 TRINITY_DN926_c0_g1~~TRINITY_DN926_c0_g1_i1.p1  ORF type:complete len:111 (+),score=46.41 TRINITY_DN926_c0_g1_i1:99-431(+)